MTDGIGVTTTSDQGRERRPEVDPLGSSAAGSA